MAPEIVEKKEYSGPPADMWALTVLLYALLCGCFPYKGETDEKLYARICACAPHLGVHLSQKVKEFFKVSFTYDPDFRPNAFEILEEKWLKAAFERSVEDGTEIKDKYGHSLKIPKRSQNDAPLTDKQKFAQLLGVKPSEKPKPKQGGVLERAHRKREESNVVHHTHLHLTHVRCTGEHHYEGSRNTR